MIQGSSLSAGPPTNVNILNSGLQPCGVNPTTHGLFSCKDIVGTKLRLQKPGVASVSISISVCEIRVYQTKPNSYPGTTYSCSGTVLYGSCGNFKYHTTAFLKNNSSWAVSAVQANPLGYFQVQFDTPRWINKVVFLSNVD